MNRTLYGETEQTKTKRKTCIMSVFEVLIYQNTKTHEWYSIRRNRITLPKPCILSVIHIVSYQNAKMHGKPPIWKSETTLSETCVLGL